MQKRKSPVLLVTALVILVAGVALYTTASLMEIQVSNIFSGPSQDQQRAVAESRRLSDEDRQSSLDDLRQQIGSASQMTGAGAGASSVNRADDDETEIPMHPSVEMMPIEAQRPDYNESSTAAMWYDEDSDQQRRSEELDRHRSGN